MSDAQNKERRIKKQFMWLFAIFAKSAKLAKVAKALKFIKFAKVFLTLGTMALSAFVYSFMWGPWFATGFVLLLFIHEMGHVIALKMKGLPASAPVFIPMLGAVIFAPNFGSREDEAFVGYGGPLLGTLASFASFGIYFLTHHQLFLLLGYISAFLNLFNLIPIRPLDGGRVTQIFGKWFQYVGVATLLAFTLFIKEPAMLLVWILVLNDIRMNARLKFAIGITCQIAMVVLMLGGFSHQAWWVSALDVSLATVFNIGFWINTSQQVDNTDTGPSVPVPLNVRMKWFFAYASLATTLFMFMHQITPYLPKR